MKDVTSGQRRRHEGGRRTKDFCAPSRSESSASVSSASSSSLENHGGGQASNRFARLLHKTKEWKARYRIRSHVTEDWDGPLPPADLIGTEGFLLGAPSRKKTHSSGSTPPSNGRQNTSQGLAQRKTRPDSFASDPTCDDSSSSVSGDRRILEDLFRLLVSDHPETGQEALSIIFHLARSSITTRNLILEAGGLSPILQQIQRDGPAELATAGAIYHLTAGYPPPPSHLVKAAIPILLNLIYFSDDAQVIILSCHVLYELSTVKHPDAPDYINAIVPLDSHTRLANLFNHDSIDVRFRALKIVNKIALADRLHGPHASRSQCKETLVTCRFLTTLKRCLLYTPETQGLALQLIQNLMVNHQASMIGVYPEILRVYFNIALEKIGFEHQVISSLLLALRNAAPEEVIYLTELGAAAVLGECLAESKKLIACFPDLQSVKEQHWP